MRTDFTIDFAGLRRKRRELEKTQAWLAEEAGVSRVTVNRTEKGHRGEEVTLAEMYRYAEAFGVPINKLHVRVRAK